MKKKYFITVSVIILGILTLLRSNLNNDMLAVYIDNELKDTIPSKSENLYINKIDCDNDVAATWDNDNWGLFISNLSKKTKCNLRFIHDMEKPYWQIENVEKTSVLSTDIFEFKISGNDALGNVSSTLNVSNLSFYVNDTLESPIKVELAKQEELSQKITYSIKVHMVGGEGSLKVKISGDTLTDTSDNQNDEITLETGINVSKNPAKILFYYNTSSGYTSANLQSRTKLIENYYKEVIKTTDYTIDEIKENNFDIVVFDEYVWGVPTIANTIYKEGINVYSMGNDSANDLDIIESAQWHNGSGIPIKIDNNVITKYLPDTLPKDDDSQRLINFSTDVTVLYKNTTDSNEYDTVGYLSQNNVTWFHSQNPNIYIYSIPIIEFTLGELK